MNTEQIEWISIEDELPDNEKDKKPLLAQRNGSFEFSIWHRLSYLDDKTQKKVHHWVVSSEIKFWARIKGVK